MTFTHIKNAFVDLDGTMLDSEGCWLEAYRLACERSAVPVLPHILQSFGKLSFSEWSKLVAEQPGIFGELTEYAKEVYTQRLPKKAVMDIVYALPDGCKRTVITREPCDLVRHWLKHSGITVFDEVITAGDGRMTKEFYAVPSLLLIDDNYKHCSVAKAAGATVIGVNDHHSYEQKKLMRAVCDLYLD